MKSGKMQALFSPSRKCTMPFWVKGRKPPQDKRELYRMTIGIKALEKVLCSFQVPSPLVLPQKLHGVALTRMTSIVSPLIQVRFPFLRYVENQEPQKQVELLTNEECVKVNKYLST